MKNHPILSGLMAVACFSLLSFSASGQTTVAWSEVMSDIAKADGEYCQYNFDLPAPTSPPRGYRPFYISHYGRHGARYALSEDVYEWMKEVLEQSLAEGKLTEKGRELCVRYRDFYPNVAYRGGELTQLGQRQLRRIAARMYHDCRAVFRGDTHVEAISTPSPRVIMSMLAFLDELNDRDKSISIHSDAGKCFLTTLLPSSKESPAYTSPRASAGADPVKAYFAALIRPEEFCTRFFTDTEFLERNFGMWKFQNNLRTIVADLPSLDFKPTYEFDDLFTDAELYNLWKYRNYSSYVRMGRSPEGSQATCMASGATVKEMIESADRDIATGETQLRLRFGHDTGLMPLLAFLKVDTFGIESADKDEIERNFKSFDIVMAANLQLVFYRSRNNPLVLVKCLFNGREASLPFPAVEGPYYSWDDFKACYAPLVAESFRSLQR